MWKTSIQIKMQINLALGANKGRSLIKCVPFFGFPKLVQGSLFISPLKKLTTKLGILHDWPILPPRSQRVRSSREEAPSAVYFRTNKPCHFQNNDRNSSKLVSAPNLAGKGRQVPISKTAANSRSTCPPVAPEAIGCRRCILLSGRDDGRRDNSDGSDWGAQIVF